MDQEQIRIRWRSGGGVETLVTSQETFPSRLSTGTISSLLMSQFMQGGYGGVFDIKLHTLCKLNQKFTLLCVDKRGVI